MSSDAFPRRFALAGRFTLGRPQQFGVSPDGRRVAFLRSANSTDRELRLWVLDVEAGRERLVADPGVLLAGSDEQLSAVEKARRERSRQTSAGIVGYATDQEMRRAIFTLSGRLWLADLITGTVTEVGTGTGAKAEAGTGTGAKAEAGTGTGPKAEAGTGTGPKAEAGTGTDAGTGTGADAGAGADAGTGAVAGRAVIDPRLDPNGQRIAYVSQDALHVLDLDDGTDRELAGPEGPDISYGLAEHVAAEEMGRSRGFWWAPDGQRLLVARVDVTKVQRWYLADPAQPQLPPRQIAYPVAGTANADVSLWLIGLDGQRTEVAWDRAALEYLVAVSWGPRPLIVVQSRDQRTVQIRQIDPGTGQTSLVHTETDAAWVAVRPGVPALTASGALAWIAPAAGTERLILDGQPVTPDGLQVREVLDVDGDTVLFAASQDPTQIHLWTYHYRPGQLGPGPVGSGSALTQLTQEPGVHTGRQAGGVTVVASYSLAWDGLATSVLRDGQAVARIADHSASFGLDLRIELISSGERELRSAVLLPSWHTPGTGPLPVLLSPYGGPAGQQVLQARTWWFGVDQWFAEEGFAVLVTDGRGTPGRGPAWDRTVYGDIIGPVLEDQVDALHDAAARYPDLDLTRVGIRGWSYGGYLAAAAVLRRPEVFHAAVAGAGVYDQRLYDTYWRERFLGRPQDEPDSYRRNSLIPDAARLTRPLLLIQGMTDDNVIAANTLRFSAALLAAGRPHQVLPLSGTTHMASKPEVTENMLRLQLDFLRGALAAAAPAGGAAIGPDLPDHVAARNAGDAAAAMGG